MMAKEASESNELTAQQLIEQFKIEPTICINPSLHESPINTQTELDTSSQRIIPTSNSNAVQFSQRPMYSSSYNPMHERRTKAIQTIYQFLAEENLTQTLHQLQQETRISYDSQCLSDFGVLLEALDLRSAYHSAQNKWSHNTANYIEILKSKQKSDEKPCINLLYKFEGIHKSNILCIDVFYYENATYIISGVATRSLMILSCKDILNNDDDSKECMSRIVSQMNGLCGPPLYIDIDPKYKRYAMVTCMDGSIYVIDLHSTIDGQTPHDWKHVVHKHHNKYVIIGRWSAASQYLLTAAHDNKATLYQFEKTTDKDEGFVVNKLHQYEFGGCVEAIAWVSDQQFVISVRNSNVFEYYAIEESIDICSYLEPYLKCNVNPFGDGRVSFCVGDMHVSKDGKFILAKTDHERVLLMIKGTEDILRTYYGSHSDLYTYSRCCFSKEGKYIYASHHNDFVVWDALSAKLIYRQTNAHQKTLRDLCLDSKHGLIITASFDRTIKIWSP